MSLNTIFNIDKLIRGPLKGVRFWSYSTRVLPPRSISSFQHDLEWTACHPTQSDMEPTMENLRGINVYKTEDDAMLGSADAVNGVIEDVSGGWLNCKGGLVLGEVEFFGSTIEWEYGYTAQYVRPTKFLRGWGYQPEQMVDDLNTLWFASSAPLSFSESVMLAIQRGGIVTVPDIGGTLKQTFATLATLESKGFVSWKHAIYDDGVMYQRQKDVAWEQGQCLRCHRPARADGACKGCKPRLYQITTAGQDALLAALRGENHG